VPTLHEKIMVLKAHKEWNGYGSQKGFQKYLMDQLHELYNVALEHDVQSIRCKMKEIVPEYVVQDSTCVL